MWDSLMYGELYNLSGHIDVFPTLDRSYGAYVCECVYALSTSVCLCMCIENALWQQTDTEHFTAPIFLPFHVVDLVCVLWFSS